MATKAKSSKKGRKIHRHIDAPSRKCYVNEQRWIKNKAIKLARHIKKHPLDKQSVLKPRVDYKVIKVIKRTPKGY